jgi:hypothetical protein
VSFRDIRDKVIIDRVGMKIKLVPHVSGPSVKQPQSGLYAYWRRARM